MSFLVMDIAGLVLDPQDKALLSHPAVAGIILFSRNFQDVKQLRELTHSIKSINPDLVIFVDQEGGRVQRFRQGFTSLPSLRAWTERYVSDPEFTLNEMRDAFTALACELKNCGVDASLSPVLDVDYGISDVIAERSFGQDVAVIKQLAGVVIDVLQQNGMPTTGKHFPGHGAVALDSHKDLPYDHRKFEAIEANDLVPYHYFINRLDAIMPAHIVYPAIDDKPASLSYQWLNGILREQMGYQGLIISDDLSMQATESYGTYVERAQLALEAGCDVILACNHRKGVEEILDHYSSNQPIPNPRLKVFMGRSTA